MDYDARRWGPQGGRDTEHRRTPPGPVTRFQASEPVDLWARHKAPQLPIRLLPSSIEEFALVQSTLTGADAAGFAMAALTVCAAAIPDSIKVQVKRHDSHWREAPRIWCALIGSPSTKKSPIISSASRPLCRLDAKLQRDYNERLAGYESLPADERKKAVPPSRLRLRLEDTTVEAAQEVLKDSHDGVLVLQDEMAGFFGSMDKYGGAKGAAKDRGFWLQAYNGGSYAVDRIKRGSGLIENLSISLLGGIQPEPIRAVVGDAVDDGLIQRLLPIVLSPACVGKDEPLPDVVVKYEELISKLNALGLPSSQDAPDQRRPLLLRFDEQAQRIRTELEAHHHDLMQVEEVNRKLAAHIGKYDGIFARFCVVWHAIENAYSPMIPHLISASVAERVARFLHDFLLPHAIAFYSDVLGLSDHHDKLIDAAGYILAHSLDEISIREFQRGSRSMRGLDRDFCRKILEQLDALGWLEEIPGPRSDAPRWRVEPRVHVIYAAKAQAERERRKQVRGTIKSIFQCD
jgi:hypothetical protein